MTDGVRVKVGFRYLDSGWKHDYRELTYEELSLLLKDAMVVCLDEMDHWDTKLKGLTLKLKDGRKCNLTEENCGSWEGSSEGWIDVFVDEEWK